MAKMTLGQWRQQLGDAVALELAPRTIGMPSMQVLRGINTGKIPLHTFRAADGRVIRMVKTRDLQAYRQTAAAQPTITVQGMQAAFKEMAES